MGRRRAIGARGRQQLAGVLLTALLCAVGFVLLTVYAGTRSTPPTVDLDVQAAFLDHRSGALTTLARTFTVLGSSPELYAGLLAGVLVTRLRASRTWSRLAVCCLLWFGAGQLLRTAVNQVIDRPRPARELRLTGAAGDAFPSGHSTSATMAYGLMVVLVAAYAHHRRTVLWTGSLATVLAVGVGLSRIYLGVHWPTDVAAGWLLGVFWLCTGAAVLIARSVWRPPVDASPQLSG